MARRKEFEVNEALDQGMHLFWSQGYEATSLDDLLRVMQLSKSSFYETFQSKHDLLLTALTRYIDLILGQLADDLENGSARAAIGRSFETVVHPAQRGIRGCFVQNCAVELAHRDAQIRAKVHQGLRRLEDGYFRAVKRAQKNGEIGQKRDARALSRYLVSSLNGLQVLVKAGVEDEALRDVVRVILGAL